MTSRSARIFFLTAFLAHHLPMAAGDADSLAWENAMSQMVVTATRTPKLLKDVPVTTRVISAEDIRRADVNTVAELLQQEMPGMEFAWAMSREVSLNMSGFGGNSILFLVDGERLAGETMDNPDYQRLSLDNVERIEIVRGAASSLYGSSAVGGVVNIITRKATKPLSVNLGARVATHQDERYSVALGNRLCRLSNALTAAYTHSGQYEMSPFSSTAARPQDAKGDLALVSPRNHTWNFADRLSWKPSQALELTARAGYYYRERGYDETQDNRYRDFSGGLKSVCRLADGHSLEVAYSFDQYDKSDYSPITRYDVRDYSNVQHSLRALSNNRLSERLTLTSGADVMRDYLISYMFADGGRSQWTADAFIQADYEPTRRWELVGGVRYDYYSASSASSVTGKVAARYRACRNLTLRASYSGGFRAPTLKEMYMDFDMAGIFMIYGNRHLLPERSHNIQLAAELTPGKWELTASLFCNFVDNRITTLWDGSAAGLYGNDGAMRYQNIGRLDILGAECHASRRFGSHWSARVSYCFNHVHVRSASLYSDNTRPHSLTARAGYSTRLGRNANISATLSGRYLSAMDVYELDDSYTKMNSVRTRYSGYAIVKMAVQMSLPHGLSLNLAADNILDYKPREYTYYSPKTTGTAFSVGAGWKF